MSQVSLTYNSSTIIVDCNSVQIGWSNNIVSKPKANGGEAVEVQTQSFENPTYTLMGVELTERSGTLTYAQLVTMAKHQYDGTNAITLTVNYGESTTKNLIGSDGTTTAIPVVIKSFSPQIPLTYTSDGTNTFLSMSKFNIVLQETA